MRAVDLCPVVKEREDRVLLSLQQAVDRMPAGRAVPQTAGATAFAPAPCPRLADSAATAAIAGSPPSTTAINSVGPLAATPARARRKIASGSL